MECGLQGAVCIWNGWSGSREPVCEGLHVTCGMCKIFFLSFFLTNPESSKGSHCRTWGHLTHIFKSSFKLQALGTLGRIFLLSRQRGW